MDEGKLDVGNDGLCARFNLSQGSAVTVLSSAIRDHIMSCLSQEKHLSPRGSVDTPPLGLGDRNKILFMVYLK